MLVIGCGNRNRSDDGAGVMVAERVRKLGVHAEICTGESLALIETWSRADDVILVDAVVTGAPAGKVWLWNARSQRIQGSASTSTHGLGVAAVSYTHLRAHETVLDLVCRLLLEKKKK